MVDQVADNFATFEPYLVEVGQHRRWWWWGRPPVPCPVRAVGVVLPLVLGQHLVEVALAIDQESVGAFASYAADRAFGYRVRSG